MDRIKTQYGNNFYYQLKPTINDGYWKVYFPKEDSLLRGLYEADTASNPDTIFYEGYYKKGLKEGKHLTYWGYGNLFKEEYFKNGIADSIVKEYYPTGELSGTWNYYLGKQDGDSYSYNSNGQVGYHEKFKNGIMVDTAIYYFASGKIKDLIIYLNDSGESKKTEYYENGQISFIGFYKNEFQSDGTWTFWDKDGKKYAEQIYKNGELIKTINY